jgi:hypothetical protein
VLAPRQHFVLELVQNADDCSFVEGATPTLRICADQDRIEFFNNEVGFTERNVLALCSMGESTKKASDAGYIGNKGIGAWREGDHSWPVRCVCALHARGAIA